MKGLSSHAYEYLLLNNLRNVVGKNPHLITVTPERSDHMLQENDILSIGRRDREPWMR